MNTRQLQRGVGMVEVLVAALIMAIGILGYAAMQVRTLQEATNSQYRMQALALAGDLIARIRANTPSAGATPWNALYARQQYAGDMAPASCQGAAVVCTADQLATADVYAINQQLRRLLPGADISVQPNPANAATLLVRVAWNGRTPTAEQCDAPVLNAAGGFETYCVTLEV